MNEQATPTPPTPPETPQPVKHSGFRQVALWVLVTIIATMAAILIYMNLQQAPADRPGPTEQPAAQTTGEPPLPPAAAGSAPAQQSTQVIDNPEDWVLAEIRYYLNRARLRLIAFQDVPTALQLMQCAQDTLSYISAPPALQAALDEDINTLQAVELPDYDHITETLFTLDKQILTLPLAQDENTEAEQATENTPDVSSDGWQAALVQTWQELKSLVRIQRHDSPSVQAFLLPDETILRETVRLQLQRANVAALLQQQALYEASLQEAQIALQRFFDSQAQSVISTQASIEDLQTQRVGTELPPADQALTWLLVNIDAEQG